MNSVASLGRILGQYAPRNRNIAPATLRSLTKQLSTITLDRTTMPKTYVEHHKNSIFALCESVDQLSDLHVSVSRREYPLGIDPKNVLQQMLLQEALGCVAVLNSDRSNYKISSIGLAPATIMDIVADASNIATEPHRHYRLCLDVSRMLKVGFSIDQIITWYARRHTGRTYTPIVPEGITVEGQDVITHRAFVTHTPIGVKHGSPTLGDNFGVPTMIPRAREILGEPQSVQIISNGDTALETSLATNIWPEVHSQIRKGHPFPILYHCLLNGQAISRIMPLDETIELAKKTGFPVTVLPSRDPLEIIDVSLEILRKVHKTQLPHFLLQQCPRPIGHAAEPQTYAANEEFAKIKSAEHLNYLKTLILDSELSGNSVATMFQEFLDKASLAFDKAFEEGVPTTRESILYLSNMGLKKTEALSTPELHFRKGTDLYLNNDPELKPKKTNGKQGLNRALKAHLEYGKCVYITQEGIGNPHPENRQGVGVYAETAGIKQRFFTQTITSEPVMVDLARAISSVSPKVPIVKLPHQYFISLVEINRRGATAEPFFMQGLSKQGFVMIIDGHGSPDGIGGFVHNMQNSHVFAGPNSLVAFPWDPNQIAPLLEESVKAAKEGAVVTFVMPVAHYNKQFLVPEEPVQHIKINDTVIYEFGEPQQNSPIILTYGTSVVPTANVISTMEDPYHATLIALPYPDRFPEGLKTYLSKQNRPVLLIDEIPNGRMLSPYIRTLKNLNITDWEMCTPDEEYFVPAGSSANNVVLGEKDIYNSLIKYLS